MGLEREMNVETPVLVTGILNLETSPPVPVNGPLNLETDHLNQETSPPVPVTGLPRATLPIGRR